ncbi:MAG: hypothetical protein EOM05_12105 [Clostridia bacterium]|nr:hypothetical protein [Clostridia bacterium]
MSLSTTIKSKYSYLSDDEVEEILNKAKFFYYSIRYSSDPLADEEKYPLTSFMAEQWILLACDEIIERLGASSATAYRENGINTNYDNAQLSIALISMLKPTIGVIV